MVCVSNEDEQVDCAEHGEQPVQVVEHAHVDVLCQPRRTVKAAEPAGGRRTHGGSGRRAPPRPRRGLWDQSFRILGANYRKLLDVTLFISPNLF